jgi:hypothetical protein
MSSRAAFLVQILLPKETGSSEPVRQQWFNGLRKELTEKLAARPVYPWPGRGPVAGGGETDRDSIAKFMADDIEDAFWRAHCLNGSNGTRLGHQILIRAQEMKQS